MNKRIRPEIVSRLLSVSAAFLFGTGAPPVAAVCSPHLEPNKVAQAEAYLSANQPKDAFGVMYPLTQSGSGGAHQYLSSMYEQGRGVVKSPYMVRHLNWMGAQYDDPESMYRAAMDFYDRGYRKDGLYWAERAHECGHPGALLLLLERSLLDRNDEAARSLLEQGIDRRLPGAMFILAEQYDKGGIGLPKDHQRAFYWYHQTAKLGHARSMSAIGYYFAKGQHGIQDDIAAIHWYHKAAKAGDVESMTAFAWMIAKGRGSQQDIPEAKYYLHKAKQQGNILPDEIIRELGLE